MRLNKSARGFAVVCVAAVAMVFAACGQSEPEVASVEQSQTAAVNPSAKATAARTQTRNPVEERVGDRRRHDGNVPRPGGGIEGPRAGAGGRDDYRMPRGA